MEKVLICLIVLRELPAALFWEGISWLAGKVRLGPWVQKDPHDVQKLEGAQDQLDQIRDLLERGAVETEFFPASLTLVVKISLPGEIEEVPGPKEYRFVLRSDDTGPEAEVLLCTDLGLKETNLSFWSHVKICMYLSWRQLLSPEEKETLLSRIYNGLLPYHGLPSWMPRLVWDLYRNNWTAVVAKADFWTNGNGKP